MNKLKDLLLKLKRKLCRHNYVPKDYFKSYYYEGQLQCSDMCTKCGKVKTFLIGTEEEQEILNKGYKKNLSCAIWQKYIETALNSKINAYAKRG